MTGTADLVDCFSDLEDPRRRTSEVEHPLVNILVIAISAVIGGADDFVMIAQVGRQRKDWFEKFLDLSNGIPSHDTFNRVLGALNPKTFEECLLSWITALHEITEGQVVAIDVKTLRRSYDRGSNKAAIHMVSAWASENHICLGQTVTDAKSNEITAIPKLLELIAIKGCLVTIDAMGCQTAIAEKIRKQDAHYVLAVKQNQPTLYKGIEQFFEDHLSDEFQRHQARKHETNERSHRRDERRTYYVCPIPEKLADAARWKDLKSIGIAITDVDRDGKDHVEVRYYILSKFISAKRFANAVRGHWSIENRLHWQLDVSFGEDQSRIRKGHGATNVSILRRTALSLLKNETSKKLGIKNKRITTALSEDYMLKVLLSQ
ncbi:MAG: ISAs1 family transposase [Planctomycetota bacterium]